MDGPAEFHLGTNGSISRTKNQEGHLLEIFPDRDRGPLGDEAVFVRVERIPSVPIPTDKSKSKLTRLRCGFLPAAKRIRLPDEPGQSPWDVWRVTVYLTDGARTALQFDVPKPADEAAIKALDQAVRENEKPFVYQSLRKKKLFKDYIAFVDDYVKQPSPANWSAAKEAAAQLDSRLDPGDSDAGRFAVSKAAFLKEYPVAADALALLRENVLAISLAAQALARSTNDDSNAQQAAAHLEDVYTAAVNRFEPPKATVCKDVYAATAYEAPSLVETWKYGTFELPTTPTDRTVMLYAGGGGSPSQVKDGMVTAWAVSVPAGKRYSFLWDTGVSNRGDDLKTIASFLTAVVTKLPAAKLGGGPEPTPRPKYAEDFDDLFNELTTRSFCASKDKAFEQPFAPLATFETQARTTQALHPEALENDHTYNVYACDGPCAVTGSKSNAVAKAQVVTPSGWGLSLFGGVTYDFRFGGGGFVDYQWRPTAKIGQAQQVYQLDAVDQPLQQVSTSLLLTLLFPEGAVGRFGVGFGPSIVYGDGKGGLQQWTGQLVWLPPFPKHVLTDKLYLTVGAGFRLHDQPIVYQEGDRLALPVTNLAPPTPPTLSTRKDVWPVGVVGVALDLSILGDAASTIFGAKASSGSNSNASATGAQ